MNKILKHLYKTRLLKLKESKIIKWAKKKRTDNLSFAVEFGDYNIRISALNAIAEVSPNNLKSILIDKMDDPISSVSLFAIRLFEEKFTNHEMEDFILNKKQFWKLAEITEQNNLKKNGYGNLDPLWKKADLLKTSRTNNFRKMQSNMSPDGSQGGINTQRIV